MKLAPLVKTAQPAILCEELEKHYAALTTQRTRIIDKDQINRIEKNLLELKKDIKKYEKTLNSAIPPFSDPYYWAGFVINGWGF